MMSPGKPSLSLRAKRGNLTEVGNKHIASFSLLTEKYNFGMKLCIQHFL